MLFSLFVFYSPQVLANFIPENAGKNKQY